MAKLKWRNSKQLLGTRIALAKAVNERPLENKVIISMAFAKALAEIIEQAAHTEKNHENNWKKENRT